MKRGFVGQIYSAVDFQKSITFLNAAGVEIENISVGQTFSDFIATLNNGDTVVVKSYVDIVASLHELFSLTLSLAERGILIESLDEPRLNFLTNQSSVTRELDRLDGSLRKFRTKKGLDKARANGQVLGRPTGTQKISKGSMNKAVNLYTSSDMAVYKICNMTGINPRALYRHIKINGIAHRSNLVAEL